MKATALRSSVLLAAVACVCLALAPALLGQQSSPQSPISSPARGARSSQSQSASSASAPKTPEQRQELRGDIFMARKMFPQAIAAYTDVLVEHPREARVLNKIGLAYQQLNDWRHAERFYKKAGKADKSFADPWNNLGTVEFSRKKYKSAIKQYRKAIKINPRSAITFSNLGYAYLARKKYDNAIAAFRRAILLDPSVFHNFSRSGTMVEERGYDSPGMFYYMLAKTFATLHDARRCAHYLEMAREEGYKKFTDARTDPAFQPVLKNALVRRVLWPAPGAAPPS